LLYLWKTLRRGALKIRSNQAMIASYGEALVDLFVRPFASGALQADARACLGGSVFNFCLAAQRQGLHGRYLNALSTDHFGQQFAQLLKAEGALLDAPRCTEPTSIAVIELDEQGKANYAFHRNGVADTARSAMDIIATWSTETALLHTGCLMLTPPAWPETAQILAHARQAGCLVSVDANLRLAVASERLNEKAAVAAARQWFAQSETVAMVALTMGERGAWLLTREAEFHQSAGENIQVADTVGAGDTFIAALLAQLGSQAGLSMTAARTGWAGMDLAAALRHAVVAAEICVSRVGCNPPTWAQTLARLHSQEKASAPAIARNASNLAEV
jgi:fructokinase